MSRKNHETDYATALENEYARWDELFTKGGSDPFWTDGVNLELTRNHILYYKAQLAKQENSLFGLKHLRKSIQITWLAPMRYAKTLVKRWRLSTLTRI